MYVVLCACNIRVCFNLVNVRQKVHFKRSLGPLFVIHSGTQVQNGEQHQSNVIGDKVRGVPFIFEEDCPATQLQAKL